MSVDIAAENALPSAVTPQEWAISGAGSLVNVGFARQISYNVGQQARFSCNGQFTTLDIYRVGYYQNKTLRQVATVTNTATSQPEVQVIPDSNGATTCTHWSVTASWDIPSSACSGLYMAIPKIAGVAQSYIMFVVTDDESTADVIYKTSDSTWGAAYNNFGTLANPLGGSNIYGRNAGVGNIVDRALCVDYHRPVVTRANVIQTYWMACELPMIRFLERNGFRMKYVSCVDVDRDEGVLLKGKIFLSSGHDEYYSLKMRRAVESFRDQHRGYSLFFSANEAFWKTEYAYDGDRTTMWCRKDTMPGPGNHAAGVPFVDGQWQGTWKDTRWANNEPEWLLTGTDFRMNGVVDFDAPIVRNPYGGLKVWGQTSLVDSDILLKEVVGFEADSMRPTQPAQSCVVLAAYTRNINGRYADENGQNYSGNGDLIWGIISQRYTGGGLTIGFGTCQWSWVLDELHDRGLNNAVSRDAQQFTLNLLVDLGAPALSRMPELEARTRVSIDNYGYDPSKVVPGGEGGGVPPVVQTTSHVEVWHNDSWRVAEMIAQGKYVEIAHH